VDDVFLGTGWAFPIRPGTQGRLHYESDEGKIRQSIWIILGTASGERVMRPEFGCGIHDLVFEANTPMLHGLLRVKVREAVTRWEPRIDVMEVEVEAPPDRSNLLAIRIVYRIRANNAFFNLVYPFFLNEGTA
jgi:phage baseplate assembly protein W